MQTMISVYQWATHRNPEHFADANEFRPERWLPPTHRLHSHKYAGDNRNAFKPFSFGARDCVGKNLAYAEMRIVVSRIFHRFDWELVPGQERWLDEQLVFLVWQKGPLMINFKERRDRGAATVSQGQSGQSTNVVR